MHTVRLFSTVIFALLFMGCPPPAGHNSNDSASGGNNPNAPTQGGHNPDNPAQGGDNPAPIGKHHVAYVSAGGSHTMIVKTDHTLWAVGNNDNGRLGDGNTDQKLNPVQVMEIPVGGGAPRPMTNVKQVSAGADHTIILKKNDTLWAVGNNSFGQLGDGTTDQRWTPVEVKEKTPGGGVARAMTEVDQISATDSRTMIVKKNGSLWAVGTNQFGQLGDGNSGLDASGDELKAVIPIAVKEKSLGGDPARAITNVDKVSIGIDHRVCKIFRVNACLLQASHLAASFVAMFLSPCGFYRDV